MSILLLIARPPLRLDSVSAAFTIILTTSRMLNTWRKYDRRQYRGVLNVGRVWEHARAERAYMCACWCACALCSYVCMCACVCVCVCVPVCVYDV